MKRRKHHQAAVPEHEAPEVYKLSTREHKAFYPINNQRHYVNLIRQNIITIAHGSPGTGKTLCALHEGIQMLSRGRVEKIIYLKPDVGMHGQRGRGYLPGSKLEKMRPLIGPILDNLCQFMPRHQVEYLIEHETIEVLMLEDCRGRSFANCFMIFDESQNCMPGDVKTVLTRVGENSKLVVTGDTAQCDLHPDMREKNGLIDAVYRLQGLEDVGMIEFTPEDVVRHAVIPSILDRYQ